MTLKSLLMPAISQYVLGEARLNSRRRKAETVRRSAGLPHTLHYFHQADDPYSCLCAGALAALLARYSLKLQVHIVPPPGAAAAPERERLQAWSRRDAAMLARRLRLAYADPGEQPAQAVLQTHLRWLVAAAAQGERFAEHGAALCAALWRDPASSGAAVPGLQAATDAAVQAHLLESAALRQRLGHYLGGMFFYGGEWYWGLDRLHHLEQRLRGLRAQRDEAAALLFPLIEDPVQALPAAQRPAIDFFVSLRSPYSAIVTPRIIRMARLAGAELRVRYLMPMVMRGLPVPAAKRRYIAQDTAREARARGIAFGRLNDPVGRPVERGLAVLAAALRSGRGEAFLSAFQHGVWAEGVDAGADRGLRLLAQRADIDAGEVTTALADESWRATAEANRVELFELGLWGVPSFRVGSVNVWGQDRLWAVWQALQGETP